MKTHITKKEWHEYVLNLYFGGNEPLKNCINRAYRDFNRTMHGLSSMKNGKNLTTQAKEYLFNEFTKIKDLDIKTQNDFDNWHKDRCIGLSDLYKDENFSLFHIWQSQKWINMIFKYIFAYGSDYIKGYDKLYNFLHVPLDNILIDELKKYNPPKLEKSWSRIGDYSTYLEYQKWFRNKFHDETPLDVEFRLWNNIFDK